MDELAAFILARIGEDHDLAHQALHDPGVGGILGAHARTRHAADVGRPLDVAGHELLMDPLACHIINQNPQKVIADCVAKQRLVAHVQSIDRSHQQAGEQAGTPAGEKAGTPAGEQDCMRRILELMALPWKDHPEYQSHWMN